MINETILKIKQNPMLYHYLKYHSYWYKVLMRNPTMLKDMIEDMKEEYKLTPKDKIESINQKMQMVSSLLEVLR